MQEKKFRNVSFSERLLDLMQSSGKTQKELARALNVSEGALINWKRGQTPKSEELYKIARYFGTTMEFLLTGEDEHAPSGSDGWRQRCIAAEQKVVMLKSGLKGLLEKL